MSLAAKSHRRRESGPTELSTACWTSDGYRGRDFRAASVRLTCKFAVLLVPLGLLGCSSDETVGGNGGSAPTAGQGNGGRSGSAGTANGGGTAGGTASGGSSGSSSRGGSSGTSTTGGAPGTGGSAPAGGAGASGAAPGGAGSGASGGLDTGGGGAGGTAAGFAGAAGASGGAGGTAGAGAGAGAGGSGGAGDPVDARAMAAAMGFGTNIGNTLENTTTWETGWGQPLISETYINGMASRGIKTVRVPVAWDTYAVNGTVEATKMDRVKQVVAWIEAAGMYSIVNIHWDGGWIDNDTEGNPNRYRLTEDTKAKFASYWTQIATAFSGVGHKLVLEGLNEESKFYVNGDSNQGSDYAALNTLNQLFVTTVRAQAGFNRSRALLIAGLHTDIELTCVDAFQIPNDPAGACKLFLSLHYYTPYTFCGLDTVESWGSPQTTWGTTAERATLAGLFDKLAAFSQARAIPVILGEFAVTPGQNYPRDPTSRSAWMEAVTKASLDRGIVPVLWDTGSEISRTDGSFSAELQAAMSAIQ